MHDFNHIASGSLMEMVSSISGLTFVKDLQSRYLSCSEPLLKALGLSSVKEIQGKSDADLPWSSYSDIYQNSDRVAQNIGSVKSRERTILFGIETSVLVTKCLLKNDRGQKVAILGVIQVLSDPMHCPKLVDVFSQDRFFSETRKSDLNSMNTSLELLTPRESEVLFYVIRGKTANCIAKILGLSHRTIEMYVDSIKEKFSCRTKEQLIEKCFADGIVYFFPHSLTRKKVGVA